MMAINRQDREDGGQLGEGMIMELNRRDTLAGAAAAALTLAAAPAAAQMGARRLGSTGSGSTTVKV